MLDYVRTAIRIAEGRSRDDLDRDEVLRLALTRAIEVIGEAANRVSQPMRSANPQLPWSHMIGTRHRLIHGYDAVDLDILWRIIHDDLPTLRDELERMVSGWPSDGG